MRDDNLENHYLKIRGESPAMIGKGMGDIFLFLLLPSIICWQHLLVMVICSGETTRWFL